MIASRLNISLPRFRCTFSLQRGFGTCASPQSISSFCSLLLNALRGTTVKTFCCSTSRFLVPHIGLCYPAHLSTKSFLFAGASTKNFICEYLLYSVLSCGGCDYSVIAFLHCLGLPRNILLCTLNNFSLG